jgi:serine/threonine protein phosphatase PrpC
VLQFLIFYNLGEERYLFAVFDGHGGNQVAEFARDTFVKELLCNKNFISANYEKALTETFIKMDDLMLTEDGNKELNTYTVKEVEGKGDEFNPYSDMDVEGNIATCCGCTACVCLVVGDKVYCANAGDSRSVLSKSKKAIPLSFDHKPSNTDEEKRIDAAGGFVECDRVNGNLNLSRALGDFTYKENKEVAREKQMVLCIPEIKVETIDKDTEFFIIACDGIWDCMENQEAVDFIHNRYTELKSIKGDDFKVSDINSSIFDKNLAVDTMSGNSRGKEGAG